MIVLNLQELVILWSDGHNIGLNVKMALISAQQLLHVRMLSHMRSFSVLHVDIKRDQSLERSATLEAPCLRETMSRPLPRLLLLSLA